MDKKDKKKKLIFIDSNTEHLSLLKEHLRIHLNQVHCQFVHCAKEAHKKLSKTQFDLIITEINFDESRIKYIKELKSNSQATPILILTGIQNEKNVARMIKAGAEDYILKTKNSLEVIHKIIHRCLVKHDTEKQNKNSDRQQSEHLLNKLDSVQNSLNKLKDLHIDSHEERHSLFDSIFSQVKSAKDSFWNILKS